MYEVAFVLGGGGVLGAHEVGMLRALAECDVRPDVILGTSVGATGTALSQQHLRNVLAYLDVALLGQPEMFIKHDASRINEKGEIVNEDTRKFLQGFVDTYVAWVKRQLGR